jgi:hypothetical protein
MDLIKENMSILRMLKVTKKLYRFFPLLTNKNNEISKCVALCRARV